MALNPQAAAVLAQLPDAWRDLDAINSMTAEKARAMETETIEGGELDGGPSLPAGVTVENIEMSGAMGLLRGRVHRPSAKTPSGTVLWIPGGGFIMAPPATDPFLSRLALGSGCAVVSVEYRLAPEHRFPAALEDCYAVLSWVTEHAPLLGGDAGPVAIGGGSAGANLAAALTLMAHTRGGPEIAFQVLLEPMIARAFDRPSDHDPDVVGLARTEAIEWLWQQYLGDDAGSDPMACPLCAESFAGLPPALVVTAECDVLRDEGEAYAERLRHDGVPVELRRYDGMFHGFEYYPGVIDAADECIALIGTAFRRALQAEAGD
jgi:acetyl esterase